MDDLWLMFLIIFLIGFLIGIIAGEKACESRMRIAFKKKEIIKLRGKKFRVLDAKRCERMEKILKREEE